LAAELKQAFPDADVRLIPSSGGVFEVTLDGKLLFSKKASRRHAEPGEVLRLLREAVGQEGGKAG
jgi:selenoprotein W-related protein